MNTQPNFYLEAVLGYTFKDNDLLERALTHPSYTNALPEPKADQGLTGHYERLEFLGDAVLGFILTDILYQLYPEKPEGELARARAVLIQASTLAYLARKLDIGPFIRLSKVEKSLKAYERDNLLEDCLEALVGAIYLDSDYTTVKTVVLEWYGSIEVILNQFLPADNPKGRLQELYPSKGGGPQRIQYILKECHGADHQRVFHMQVLLEGKVVGEGVGNSKKRSRATRCPPSLSSLIKGA